MTDTEEKISNGNWARRLAFSFLIGAASVIFSTVFFIALDSNNPSTVTKIFSYGCALPLLPGVGFVSAFFNSRQVVHGGQIALIPIVSLPADVFIIFGTWSLLKRRKASAPNKHVTLNIDQ